MRLVRELDAVEMRVLGSLLEKQQATPEGYPLTLNALVLGCNQKTNREPVLQLSEADVVGALDRLRELVLVWRVTGVRSERWEHNLDARWELDPETKALLTLLLLRGSQTPGELRARSERLHTFTTVEAVEETLRRMAAEAEPLVFELPRRPGQKESRWSHLVGGTPPGTEAPEPVRIAAPEDTAIARISHLEERVSALEAALAELKKKLGENS